MDTLNCYKPFELKFLGLRYINQIDNPEINNNIDKWSDFEKELGKYTRFHN